MARSLEIPNSDESLLTELETNPDFINSLPIVFENNQEIVSNGHFENIAASGHILQTETYFTALEIITPNYIECNNPKSSGLSENIEPVIFLESNTLEENELQDGDRLNIEDFITEDNIIIPQHDDISITDRNNSPEMCQSISDESDQNIHLVDYSEHSDSASSTTSDKVYQRKRKKRCQVDMSTWTSEENKRKREKGLEYFGRKKQDNVWNNKVPKEPKRIKRRCQCKVKEKGQIKCFLITENDRQTIFNFFWNMAWGEKKIFIDSLVKILPTNRYRDRKQPAFSRRKCSIIYNLKKEEKLIRVCKTMFLNTLCIGKWCVLNWKKATRSPKDIAKKPGSSEESPHTFSKENKVLTEFFENLPTMESHYCRKSTQKKYILPEWSSKRSLYNFYKDNWCRDHEVKPLSVCTFNNVMDIKNISLFHPKKDQCQICNSYKLGQYPNDEHATHIQRKEEAREEKERDKDNESFVYTMDMQAVLLAPRSNVSSLYYKTKLCVHNFCVFDLKTKQGFCYLWHEAEGGLNAEEFATIVAKFLLDEVIPKQQGDKEKRKIILYSDGCTYQNRNAVMSNALLNLAMMSKITIEQKFLEVGHTQMEADSMHATIERRLKGRIVNIPAEYITICKEARKNPEPYTVHYLTHEFFKKFDSLHFYNSIRPGRKKGDPKVCYNILLITLYKLHSK